MKIALPLVLIASASAFAPITTQQRFARPALFMSDEDAAVDAAVAPPPPKAKAAPAPKKREETSYPLRKRLLSLRQVFLVAL